MNDRGIGLSQWPLLLCRSFPMPMDIVYPSIARERAQLDNMRIWLCESSVFCAHRIAHCVFVSNAHHITSLSLSLSRSANVHACILFQVINEFKTTWSEWKMKKKWRRGKKHEEKRNRMKLASEKEKIIACPSFNFKPFSGGDAATLQHSSAHRTYTTSTLHYVCSINSKNGIGVCAHLWFLHLLTIAEESIY